MSSTDWALSALKLTTQESRLFVDLVVRSKSTMGWFYGLKLHCIFNQYGEIVGVLITPAHIGDRERFLQRAF